MLEWRLVITVVYGTRYQIVIIITKRHLKIIPLTFGAILLEEKSSINGQTALIL